MDYENNNNEKVTDKELKEVLDCSSSVKGPNGFTFVSRPLDCLTWTRMG